MKVDYLAIKFTIFMISSRTKHESFDSFGSPAPFFLFCYDLEISVKLICVIRKNDIQLRLKDPLALNDNDSQLDSQVVIKNDNTNDNTNDNNSH